MRRSPEEGEPARSGLRERRQVISIGVFGGKAKDVHHLLQAFEPGSSLAFTEEPTSQIGRTITDSSHGERETALLSSPFPSSPFFSLPFIPASMLSWLRRLEPPPRHGFQTRTFNVRHFLTGITFGKWKGQ